MCLMSRLGHTIPHVQLEAAGSETKAQTTTQARVKIVIFVFLPRHAVRHLLCTTLAHPQAGL